MTPRFRTPAALAAAVLLSSCALPFMGGGDDVPADTGATASGAVSAEAKPATVEEFAARELSGAILETEPSANSGTATQPTASGTEHSGSAPAEMTAADRIRAAREAHRKNLFSAFVRRGDWYFLRDDKETALKSYLVALSRSNASAENKATLSAKIGDTYFDLKKFPEAVSFYKKSGAVPEASALKFALALSYVDDAEKVSLLPSLPLTDDQKKYFAISYACREGADRCVDLIRNYSGTGELATNLKASLADFEALAADDVAYRDALLASAFLKNKDFAAAAAVADEVLKKRPDYKPVLKLAGRAWWEIGRYDEAVQNLQRYYRANSTDVEVAYLLGLCYLGKEDYATSTVFFNRAVLGGYSPRLDAERHLAYGYFMMGSPDNVWQVLTYLLRDPESSENDYATSVWLALSGDDVKDATAWTTAGLAKFPASAWLQALRARLARLAGDPIAQKNAIDAAMAAGPDNPLALLERGIWLADRNDPAARDDLSRVAELDPEGVFGSDAQERLAKIDSGITLSGTVAPDGSGASLPAPAAAPLP